MAPNLLAAAEAFLTAFTKRGYKPELDALRLAVTEAKREPSDTQRLDWLGNHPPYSITWDVTGWTLKQVEKPQSVLDYELRDVIDSAMAAEPGKEKL